MNFILINVNRYSFYKVKKIRNWLFKIRFRNMFLFYDINFFINIVVYKESLLDLIRIKSGKVFYVLKCRLI